ncbi:2-amino-4-hydroxy-6-hydroxymethyldihydropteridine diphosphokinase [Arenicella chitinivorans]|uniref:2-amino-4-hydroxy-6-hydroxymethyldihydropteridine pyrophosphokinase n=1 Tax=Arenicella chitinivorans TaxID=1329800 RepID=A0A918VHG3_9GAMM|nr:2-amino-4-hydroxy-6-hydroxymethyldihydropteridine diphosphokinase [Arenicella chitinivorans]GGZ99150.1 2-amino-4-hydroxy-6-hydroxymethyldihydropteridine diphosphokinase [Arenicella chitinivorans]
MSQQTVNVYLGLGANLGDPMQQLVDARSALRCWHHCLGLRCSRFYLTSPVGYAQQPDFINCVVEMQTRAPLDKVFVYTQELEQQLGRRRDAGNQNAPRTIDIDVLLYGDHIQNTERLTVPHPRLQERLFVLLPLAELLADNHHALIGSPTKLVSEPSRFEGQFVSLLRV